MIFSDNKVALLEDANKDIIRSRFLRFLQDNYMCKYQKIILIIKILIIFYGIVWYYAICTLFF